LGIEIITSSGQKYYNQQGVVLQIISYSTNFAKTNLYLVLSLNKFDVKRSNCGNVPYLADYLYSSVTPEIEPLTFLL